MRGYHFLQRIRIVGLLLSYHLATAYPRWRQSALIEYTELRSGTRTSDLFLNPQAQPMASSTVLNQFYNDVALQRALGLFLPSSVRESITAELVAFGDKVLSEEVLHLIADAEKNPIPPPTTTPLQLAHEFCTQNRPHEAP